MPARRYRVNDALLLMSLGVGCGRVYGHGTLIVAGSLGFDGTRCRGLIAVVCVCALWCDGALLRCLVGLGCSRGRDCLRLVPRDRQLRRSG